MPLKIFILTDNTSDKGLIGGFLGNAFPNSSIVASDTENHTKEKLIEKPFSVIIIDTDMSFNNENKLFNIIKANQPDDTILVITSRSKDIELINNLQDKKKVIYISKPIRYSMFSEQVIPYLEGHKDNKESDKLLDEKRYIQNIEKCSQCTVDKDLKGIIIPPQPKIIMDVSNEIRKPHINFKKLSDLIKMDVFMASRVLKLANSSVYGGGKVDSILTALNVLGLNTFKNLVISVALQNVLEKWGAFDERFWAHSLSVAHICDTIAKRQFITNTNLAYLVGLFHDSAIPILMKKFKTYRDYFNMVVGNTHNINKSENKIFKTNHCVLSALIVKTWGLPSPIYVAIENHHNSSIDLTKHRIDDLDTSKLWATVVVAEQLYGNYSTAYGSFFEDEEDWQGNYGRALEELELSLADLKDIKLESFSIIDSLNI
ncbi:MAG: HDOD domain-containing protein [Candidatus Magnetoovum sp. WYHC-5]|nr:HDOD domain-containing protein [Candidatus Magnetoovum sp. WYHC-5]